MAEKTTETPPVANRETTDLHVHQGMHIHADSQEPANNLEEKLTANDIARQNIFARRNEQMQKELDLGKIMEEEAKAREPAPEAPAAPEAASEPSATEPPAASAPAPTEAPAPPAQRVIKVDGKEIPVNEDELLRLAQLGFASNQRFQEAAALRQEAYELSQRTQQNPVTPQVAVPPQASPSPTSTQILDEKEAQEIARRLQYGSQDDTAKAIIDLGTTIAQRVAGRTQGPTPDQIVAVAVQEATRQAQANIQFESNLAAVGNEYPEIFKDRGLSIVAADAVGNLRSYYANQGVAKPEIVLYREACNYVRNRYPSASPAPSPAPQEPSHPAAASAPDKLERKRAAPQLPVAANARGTLEPSGPRAPTPSEIVNQMRKSRFQPALN